MQNHIASGSKTSERAEASSHTLFCLSTSRSKDPKAFHLCCFFSSLKSLGSWIRHSLPSTSCKDCVSTIWLLAELNLPLLAIIIYYYQIVYLFPHAWYQSNLLCQLWFWREAGSTFSERIGAKVYGLVQEFLTSPERIIELHQDCTFSVMTL